jgi:hypothetical protein
MRAPAVITIFSLLALAASGCGGGSSSKSVTTAAAPAAAKARKGPFMPDGPSGHAVVWAVGDGADGGPGAVALAKVIARRKPDLFLYLGDIYPDGAKDVWDKAYAPSFGRMAAITAPTSGNHDYPEEKTGYVPYWTKTHGVKPPPYYSFRAGGWQFFSLNSEIPAGAGSPQLRWLKKQLAGAKGTCRIGFWHRPRYSAGTVHGDNPAMEPLWQALKGHASLILNGHEHNMQRMKPRDGMVEIVAGAGGHSFYGLQRGYRGLAFSRANEFGKTIDTSSVACRP